MAEPGTERRLIRLRRLLSEMNLDGFLVAAPENRYYLSGFEADDLLLTETSGYLLITAGDLFLLTDSRYQEAAASEAPAFDIQIYKEGVTAILPDLLRQCRIRRLGTESHVLTHQKYGEIERALGTAHADGVLVGIDGLVEKLRLVKEPEEIDKIRAAIALTDSVFDAVWENLRPGRSEREVAWEIESGIRMAGAQAVSFPPIVAAGPNAALPHAAPSERLIAPGESVILDVGARLNLYCSDMTRTWVDGEPPPRLREIYRVVREAQLAAQDAIRAGRDSHEIDAIARKLIQDAGYGDHFGHGLGHGVGLAVHEKPGFGKQSRMVLEENMVVTVEPGIYLPGFGGVRLENMVRVTTSGCEVLTGTDRFYPW